jgi:Glyoxalase/Bleomycin resistance protein/Dioxygenase superfamily
VKKEVVTRVTASQARPSEMVGKPYRILKAMPSYHNDTVSSKSQKLESFHSIIAFPDPHQVSRCALAPHRPMLFPPTGRSEMKQSIGYVAVVVQDYDDAIKFYVDTLGFSLVEDTFIEAQNKR